MSEIRMDKEGDSHQKQDHYHRQRRQKLKRAAKKETQKRNRTMPSTNPNRNDSRTGHVSSSILVPGVILSVLVSVLLSCKLFQSPEPGKIDLAYLNVTLRYSLVAQSPAISALLNHLRRAETAGTRRVDFLALGPSGTGKSLLLQKVCEAARVPARRLVGDVDIGRDLLRLDRLATEIAGSAASGSWLVLAFDDVAAYIPQVVALVEGVLEALGEKDVTLVTMVTATTSDTAGEQGAESEKLAFAHAHVLRFRPLRQAEVMNCVRRFLQQRDVDLDDDAVKQVVRSVKFSGQYAVSGCKPAIYQLQSKFDLAPGDSRTEKLRQT